MPVWLEGGDGLEALTAEDVRAALAQLQPESSPGAAASKDSDSDNGGCFPEGDSGTPDDEGVGGQDEMVLVASAKVSALVAEHFGRSPEACQRIMAELMGPDTLAACELSAQCGWR